MTCNQPAPRLSPRTCLAYETCLLRKGFQHVNSTLAPSCREAGQSLPGPTASGILVERRPQEPIKKPITLRVGRETAGRRGRRVTTVFDLPLNSDAVRELAAPLKQRCGTGGTVKDGRGRKPAANPHAR